VKANERTRTLTRVPVTSHKFRVTCR
jgi:hypothetical protein